MNAQRNLLNMTTRRLLMTSSNGQRPRSSKNGMVFSPDKFVFTKETVEVAGFEITKKGIKPTDKYIEAIRNFPTPTNISEVRSWFGLINQVQA
jgi:hypothetical protein